MPTPTHTRRMALRDKLILIAEARIVLGGPEALRARELAKDAGCAVGAIYNSVKDMGELVHAVNERTFVKLISTIAECNDVDALEELTNMAKAYHRFVQSNKSLWRVLFTTPDPAYRDWYQAIFDQLQTHFETTLERIQPNMDAQKRSQLARATFAAIHGIVLLNYDEAVSGMPPGQVDRLLVLTVKQLASK